jgi:hypothetical protein
MFGSVPGVGMPQRLRVFVSSPGDVLEERLRADIIVDKLAQDYSRFFAIESYRWEYEPMLASGHFQDAIEPPSAFDIVVLILWSRLGTPLPEKTAKREYRGIDGRVPVTGTEWEYEEALTVAREKGAPDLLAFRNVSPALIDTRDPEARAKSNAQLDALDRFWRQHFANKGLFLTAYDEYHTLEDFAQRLEQSLRKLIERRIKSLAAESPAPIWLVEPFRGLESYEIEHAPIFFGRDAAIAKATEQLAANARAGHAFLLVSGPSGSGKSSLVKAGIVPRLMKPQRISGAAFLRWAVFRPGSDGGDVFISLAKMLTRTSDDADVGLRELLAQGQSAEQLASFLRDAARAPGFLFGNALGRLTEAGRQSGRLLAFEDAKLILVVDQLEELFTNALIVSEDRKLFIQLLGGLACSGVVWVIATLRADFWYRAAEITELLALAGGQGRIDLAAPSPAEVTEMIRKPARAAGLSFEAHPESTLSLDAVLAEHAAAAPGALPLLSFTLDELYKAAKARGDAVLTHASYEALGGLEGAITKRADEIIAGLPVAARAALPRVLRSLTTVTGGADQAPVSKPAQLEAFPAGSPARMLLDAFIEARLLVAESDGSNAPTVRLAHEALISRWKQARDQLATDRRDLETRMLIERQYGRWNQLRGRGRSSLLLRNPDLANAIDLAKRWGPELDESTREFIKQSARRARLVQSLTAAAAVLFAVVACVAIYAEWQAKEQTLKAEQRSASLAANVSQSLTEEGALDQALLLMLDAAHVFDGDTSVPDGIRVALTKALQKRERIDTRTLFPNMQVFETDDALLLFNLLTKDIWKLTDSLDPKWLVKGKPNDSGILLLRLSTNRDDYIVLRENGEVERISATSGARDRIGSFPVNLVHTDRDAALFASGVVGDQFNDRFDDCIAGIAQSAKALILKWKAEGINGSVFRCKKSGNYYLIEHTWGTLAGEARVDTLFDRDGNQFDIRDILSKAMSGNISRNVSWVGVLPSTDPRTERSMLAILLNRSVYVLAQEDPNKWTLVLNERQPGFVQFARFIGPDHLMVVEPDSGRLVLYGLGTQPSANFLASSLGNIIGTEKPIETLHRGTCVGYAIPRSNSASLPDGREIVFHTIGAATSRSRDPTTGDVHDYNGKPELDIAGAKPLVIALDNDTYCVDFSADWKRMLAVTTGKVEAYEFEKSLKSGTLAWNQVGTIQLSPDAYPMSFFVGSTDDQIVASDSTNRVTLWKQSAQTLKWTSTEIYRGDNPVFYVEPDSSGKLLILLEDGGSGDVHGFLYSLDDRRIWFDLGSDYKWLGAAFAASESEIAVSEHWTWARVYPIFSLSRLTAIAEKKLSPECRPPSPGEYRKSPCWPSTYR